MKALAPILGGVYWHKPGQRYIRLVAKVQGAWEATTRLVAGDAVAPDTRLTVRADEFARHGPMPSPATEYDRWEQRMCAAFGAVYSQWPASAREVVRRHYGYLPCPQ